MQSVWLFHVVLLFSRRQFRNSVTREKRARTEAFLNFKWYAYVCCAYKLLENNVLSREFRTVSGEQLLCF